MISTISMFPCVHSTNKNPAMSENELQQPPAKHKTLNKLSYKQENCSWMWKQVMCDPEIKQMTSISGALDSYGWMEIADVVALHKKPR